MMGARSDDFRLLLGVLSALPGSMDSLPLTARTTWCHFRQNIAGIVGLVARPNAETLNRPTVVGELREDENRADQAMVELLAWR